MRGLRGVWPCLFVACLADATPGAYMGQDNASMLEAESLAHFSLLQVCVPMEALPVAWSQPA